MQGDKRKISKFDALLSRERRLNDFDYAIGIDCGKHTGVAVWNCKERRFELIKTMLIHQALRYVSDFKDAGKGKYSIMVKVEDARQRKMFGNSGSEKWQGAGSVKRDSTIWEDFLLDLKIPHQMSAPRNSITKLDEDRFKLITKWKGRSSEHSRDAAMLVFGL